MNDQKTNKKSKVEIVNFNDMVDPKKESIKKLDPAESEEIRKKLMRLLFIVLIFGIIIFVVSMTSNNFKNSKKDENSNSPVVEEDDSKVKEEIPNGIVENNSELVSEYKNIVNIKSYDTIVNSSLIKMFNNNIKADTFDNTNKLYFASKGKSFQTVISEAGINEHQTKCNSSGLIEIDASVMKSSMEEVFGKSVVYQNNDFYYAHYLGDTLINVYKVTFVNGKYKLVCMKDFNYSSVIVQSMTDKIEKIDNNLIISKRVVFITKNGVFADPQGKQVITKDKGVVFDTYIKKGQIYKFIFTKVDDEFYFNRIEK